MTFSCADPVFFFGLLALFFAIGYLLGSSRAYGRISKEWGRIAREWGDIRAEWLKLKQ